MARIHCTTKVHRYPWEYGADVAQIVGDYFRLRYRLLPMLYAVAHEAHRSGTPLLRRCDLEWPAFPEAADSTQYLLGDDLLVAPILEPARHGQNADRAAWIPPGEWEDLWTGRTHAGPALIGVACARDQIPIFARRGGLVLSAPQRQTTGSAIWPEVIVDAFAPRQDQVQTRWLYEDDGISTACERGECVRTEFTLRQKGGGTEVHVGSSPRGRQATVRIHLPTGARAQADGCAILRPSEARAPGLFMGRGAPPPPEAGPVAEWTAELAPAEKAVFRIVWSAD